MKKSILGVDYRHAWAYVKVGAPTQNEAERLAKIRGEMRRERDTIAALRAEWGELDNPGRIEALAKRYLPLQPIAPTQFDSLDQLPDRPPQLVTPDSPDPIGAVIENLEEPASVTGSVPAPGAMAPSEDESEAEAPTAKSGRLDR